jgi:hypothetical protein
VIIHTTGMNHLNIVVIRIYNMSFLKTAWSWSFHCTKNPWDSWYFVKSCVGNRVLSLETVSTRDAWWAQYDEALLLPGDGVIRPLLPLARVSGTNLRLDYTLPRFCWRFCSMPKRKFLHFERLNVRSTFICGIFRFSVLLFSVYVRFCNLYLCRG